MWVPELSTAAAGASALLYSCSLSWHPNPLTGMARRVSVTVPSIDEGLLNLDDGRNLAFSVWGAPGAPAVLYCHGFPTNRRELELLQPKLEQHAVNARLVALNRPGYGASTFQVDRAILDWPSDVAQAADQLGIGRFSVLGVSGGSPYALACAWAMPDRVVEVGIVAGVGPMEATGMKEAAAIEGPSSIAFVRRLQFEAAALSFRQGQESRFIDKSIDTMSTPDQQALRAVETRRWFTETMRESFESGGRSVAHEAGLYRKSWGFDPHDIGARTQLWYGTDDHTVPPSVGEWLEGRLPNAHRVVWPQHGHFTWMLSDEAAELVETIAN